MMAPPSKLSITRRIRALGHAAQRCGCDAQTLVGTLLGLWCKAAFPGLPKASLPYSKVLAAEPATLAFVAVLGQLSFLEATYWLSSSYAIRANENYRKKLAMFFTPASLTKGLLDDLAEQGVDYSRQSFMDPACGGAAFLAPIALRMRTALRARGFTALKVLKHVEKHLYGCDVDKTLCELSKHFLCMALHAEIQKTGYIPSFNVRAANSLTSLPSRFGTIDVVVCNPPYRKMTAEELEPLFNKYADVIEGQPNLYALFVALCVKLLKPDGTCALVTPTSFLSGQYFSRLRVFLMTQTKVLRIGMVGDRLGVFIDVEQETALTLVRREQISHAPTAETEVSVVSSDGNYVDVGRCVLPNSGAAWPIPRTEGDVALLRRAAKSHASLADYGYTARIGAFVWNRDTRTTYASAKGAARARGDTAVPLLWSSDIASDGSLKFTGAPKANKERCFVNLGARDHRSIVRRPSVVLQRVTSNEQPRRLVAAAVPKWLYDKYGGFVGENHTVILEQVSRDATLTPKQLAQLLGTPTVDRYFRCISGATNVSAFELNQLRLPDPRRLSIYLARSYDMASAARRALEEQ